jgi:hyperosmotically inducible periplasmic protein
MRAKTIVMALVLTLGASYVTAQTTSSSSAGQSATTPDPQTVPDHSGATPASDPAIPANFGQQSNSVLQARISDALHNEPTLGSSSVAVDVSDKTIDLSGSVGSSKDKQTAERIAESFDGNRQVNDKIVVTGHGHSDLAPNHPAMNNGGTGNAPNPAMNSGTGNSTTSPPQQ